QGAMLLTGPLAGFFAPESQRVVVEALAWRNIDFSGLLAWGLKDEEPPVSEARLIDLGTMQATGMETYVNGKRAVTVAETSMTAGEFTWLMPSNLQFDSKGAVYDFTAYVPETEEAALTVLQERGLDNVKGDGSAAWVWNAETGVVDLDYVANMEKFASFNADVGFTGVKLDDIETAMNDGGAAGLLSNGAFRNFSLTLDDEEALDAVFALAALQMGGTGEDLRASVPAMIRLMGAQAAQMNPRMTDYINAMAEFVSEGGSLRISAEPAEPVSFSALQANSATAPQTLPDVVNLTVTHKP
ncbi:MAG: hypothetical protein AAFW68_09010, partial [Pseudomonadota bacterium]